MGIILSFRSFLQHPNLFLRDAYLRPIKDVRYFSEVWRMQLCNMLIINCMYFVKPNRGMRVGEITMNRSLVNDRDNRHWFILNHIPTFNSTSLPEIIDRFNHGDAKLKLFAPKIVQMQVVDGKVVSKEIPLTFHYVFLNGTFKDVKELCSHPSNSLSFMIDRGSENRYGIISDETLDSFQMIAKAYENTLPFYNIENINLESGDYVEVIDGAFAGLKGMFIPKAKSKNGYIVLAVTQSYGTCVWNIKANHVRILKFATGTKRPYDQIDAFIPKLYSALRKSHNDESLTVNEISSLSMFCQRMEIVKLENVKLEAKLSAILMCANSILANHNGYCTAAQRYGKHKNSITNNWTKALIALLLGVINNDNEMLIYGYGLINHDAKLTCSQRQLLDEYRYFLLLSHNNSNSDQ